MVEINGKKLRDEKLLELKGKLEELDEKLSLAVLQVGDDEASKVYVRQKEKMALELGYGFQHLKFKEDIKEEDLLKEINNLNEDDSVDGILVQMPIPKHLNPNVVQNAISPFKDVDGLTDVNAGKMLHNTNGLVPCTPKGILDMLDAYNIEIEGTNVVVIGRSMLVGKPVATLLSNRNATVVLCHSKTVDLKKYTLNADIIVCAVGKPLFLKEDMVKDGAVVIDVGISRIDGKLYGDVDFEKVKDKCSYITPVPGGVGPMTVAELASNVYDAHILRRKYEKS